MNLHISLNEIVFISMLILVLVFHVLIITFFTLLERKVLGTMQKRKGPNYAGFWGILQPLTDGLKLILKETILPKIRLTNGFLFAAIYVFFTSLLSLPLIPFTSKGAIVSPTLSCFLFLMFSTVGFVGIFLAGWLSNNIFALIGATRAVTQMISYELILTIGILTIILSAGTSSLYEITLMQLKMWNLFRYPVLAAIFFIMILAETNRAPFDLPEAEAELVAGYNIEYSSLSFAFFFLGEYSNIINICYLYVILFLGGFTMYYPFTNNFYVPAVSSIAFVCYESVGFSLKTLSLFFIFIWIRATLPRFRYDQLIRDCWRELLFFSIANFVLVLAFAK